MKKMRSLLSLFLSVVLLLCSALPVMAAESNSSTPLFRITSANVLAGENFDLDLTISNNPGITALQVSIEFDTSSIEMTGIEHKGLFSNPSTCSNTFNSPFKVSWYSQNSNNETENGVLATLHFHALDTAQNGDYPITVSYDEDNVFNSSFDNVYFSTENATVTVRDCLYGDVNRDGKINMKDIVLLQKHLNGYDDAYDSKAADVYFDNTINMKDIVILQQYLNGYDVTLGNNPKPQPTTPTYSSFLYGSSEMGRDLVCHAFTPENYDSTVLLNFAIHGFEDEYAHDGQVLVDNANQLIQYYKTNPDKLGTTRLLIVPCANPDGVIDGYSNNAFGRCNSNGIDLNRDFDANYVSQTSARYYTPYAFSAAESRALRDLVLDNHPNVVLDIHGWLNETIGDYEIGQIFEEEMNLEHYVGFNTSNASGYFANWAHQQGALGLLVELKSSTNVQYDKFVTAIDRILSKDYEYSNEDSRFTDYSNIDCYTTSTSRVTTYKYFNKSFSTVSYIEGTTDKVTIFKVFSNGWVKCQYPITSGYKVAYCKLSDFISDANILSEFYETSVTTDTYVYKRSDMSETFGVVYPTDKITVIGRSGSKLQIIYPLDSGGYKMGWINS